MLRFALAQYKIHLHQNLPEDDFERCVEFCEILEHLSRLKSELLAKDKYYKREAENTIDFEDDIKMKEVSNLNLKRKRT